MQRTAIHNFAAIEEELHRTTVHTRYLNTSMLQSPTSLTFPWEPHHRECCFANFYFKHRREKEDVGVIHTLCFESAQFPQH